MVPFHVYPVEQPGLHSVGEHSSVHDSPLLYREPVRGQVQYETAASHWSLSGTMVPPSGHVGSLVAAAQAMASIGQSDPSSPVHWAVSPWPVALPSPSRSLPQTRAPALNGAARTIAATNTSRIPLNIVSLWPPLPACTENVPPCLTQGLHDHRSLCELVDALAVPHYVF